MPDKSVETSGSLGLAAARGTAYGFLLRIISFTLSQLTLRFVDPVALGRASIRLELLLNTALFLGREGFRLALIRTDSESIIRSKSDEKVTTGQELEADLISSNKHKTINNVSWLSIPVGVILSFVALFAHMYSCNHMKKSTLNNSMTIFDDNSEQDYKIAGILYCVAAFVESLAEPLVIKAMQQLDVESRAAADGSAALAKAMTSVLLLNGSNPAFIPAKLNFSSKWPVTAFGMAQLIHSFVLTYILYNRKWKSIEWPSFSLTFSIKQNFDITTLKLTIMFTLQGIFKHLLTEGDRIVLTALADGYDQGVYAMASSYGGIASRLLLQPLEENARLLFAKQEKIYKTQLHKKSSKDRKGTNADHNENISQDSVNQIKTSELERTLCVILKLVLYIGLLFSCVATNYTNLLLTILAGNRWINNSDASDALSAFCCYTALLSLNGTTEAFVYGVTKSGADVGRLGLAHFLGMYTFCYLITTGISPPCISSKQFSII